MTNYEYILSECKRAHYGKWESKAVEACIDKLKGLTREELVRLFTSRWQNQECEVHEAIYNPQNDFQANIKTKKARFRA